MLIFGSLPMEEHTFVIPAYKSTVHLEECLQSLLTQSVKSKIIITTSTPDLSVKKLALKYHIDYIINTNGPKGIAADWNFALAQVQTKWATIAHLDDIYQSLLPKIRSGRLAQLNVKYLSHLQDMTIWLMAKYVKKD